MDEQEQDDEDWCTVQSNEVNAAAWARGHLHGDLDGGLSAEDAEVAGMDGVSAADRRYRSKELQPGLAVGSKEWMRVLKNQAVGKREDRRMAPPKGLSFPAAWAKSLAAIGKSDAAGAATVLSIDARRTDGFHTMLFRLPPDGAPLAAMHSPLLGSAMKVLTDAAPAIRSMCHEP